ncbi:alpha/beta fold hydrolase [Salininema proteolyticum]|uniref:Alpha/beta fold hydrolase n=1 Tax=Salininema proteolyticum TaxID=1607685 RepID=A0ABV8TZ56_9ACTN
MRRARWVEADRIRRPARPHSPWPGREYTVAGDRVFVRSTPATSDHAEPAVLVHGLGGSSQHWTDLADSLSDHVASDAIDLPGFGHSAPVKGASIRHYAQIVAGWIAQRGRGPVHLAGNSLGGAVAVWVAATRPQLVKTLTLISPAMPFTDPRYSRQSRFVPMLALPRLDVMAGRFLRRKDPEQLVHEITSSTWARPYDMDPQRYREAVDEARSRQVIPWTSTAYVGAFRGLMGSFLQTLVPHSPTLWRKAGDVRVPTLVVWGKEDRIIDVRQAPRTAAAFQDGYLLILGGVGHVAQMEDPEAVARAMAALVEGKPGRERLR